MQTDFNLYKVDMKYIRNLHNTIIFKRDRENIKYYKRLCVQELDVSCQNSRLSLNNRLLHRFNKNI